MKLRKQKHFKQEQQGWPNTSVLKSSYGYSTFDCEGPWLKFMVLPDGSTSISDRKFVRPKFILTKRKLSTWRDRQ